MLLNRFGVQGLEIRSRIRTAAATHVLGGCTFTWGGFPKLGVPLWGPYKKDFSSLGSLLRSIYSGEVPLILPNRSCKLGSG